MTKVAAIQMASGPNIGANLIEAGRLVGQAAAIGAKLVVLPENFALMGMLETDKVAVREKPGNGPIQDFLAQQAAKYGVWLVGGTIPMESNEAQRVRAACLLFDNHGQRVARYDKIHLFDVRVEESGENYTESETIQPGEDVAVVDTPFGKLGLAVCYDLRFPELFRRMLDDGMELLAVPSAFTAITGKAHWQTLLRARAVENLCYVIASAQGGYHASGRETHGESMILEPWGGILDRLPRGSGVVTAEIDRSRLESTRRTFPALQHRRIFCK
jgi:predicted amidohydrolase